MKKSIVFLLAGITVPIVFAQVPHKDKGKFVENKAGYYKNVILKGIEEFDKKDEVPKVNKSYKIDITGMDIPTSVDQFTKQWCNNPISQGNTGTCWDFSSTSFLESEIYRLTKQQIKLSEMYTAYWEYVEKAKRYIKERGNSEFSEGSECNASIRIWKTYGIVPANAYSGLLPEQTIYVHVKMYNEMNTYLKSVKANNAWNEDIVIATIKSILNRYMGIPPTKVNVSGKEMTPQEYLTNVIKLNLNDYVDIMSFMEYPYYTQHEFEVPDNWWYDKNYYNVPLDDFMNIIKNGIKNGYTIAIGGDVSEAGYESNAQITVVPTFDIPSEYIDENARQFRFNNKTTGDDHGIHLIGYMEKDGKTWFLIKDSGSSARNCGEGSKNFGFFFFHEDYVKLKMISIMVHKDLAKDILNKIK